SGPESVPPPARTTAVPRLAKPARQTWSARGKSPAALRRHGGWTRRKKMGVVPRHRSPSGARTRYAALASPAAARRSRVDEDGTPSRPSRDPRSLGPRSLLAERTSLAAFRFSVSSLTCLRTVWYLPRALSQTSRAKVIEVDFTTRRRVGALPGHRPRAHRPGPLAALQALGRSA